MSLYYEAAAVLANPDKAGGSLKSRIYKQNDLKSSPAQLVALITEASKWSVVLKDVIEKSGLLVEEKKLTPTLALLLTHDLLISKRGVVAPATHVLKLAIGRHKARLTAEFTKARIRGGYATLEAFREGLIEGRTLAGAPAPPRNPQHPRWVRINTLKTTLTKELSSTFAGYAEAEELGQIMIAPASSKTFFVDPHIPNLVALPPRIDLSKSNAYTTGRIIFQDKASCFPAYLLNPRPEDGDIIDGCAAPGNKTTHSAAILSEQLSKAEREAMTHRVIAFERDKFRTKTLEKMVKLASADRIVTIKGGRDFLDARPDAEDFANVGSILLDPSCSGSGIVGRDDAITMHLPDPQLSASANAKSATKKKRKRNGKEKLEPQSKAILQMDLDDTEAEEVPVEDKLTERLHALSAFQLRILTHAMKFPKARKITYSTCSAHFEENEGVVFQALGSPEARQHGWTILKRGDQVSGLQKWPRRGVWEDGKLSEEVNAPHGRKEEILDACIRCNKATEDGTMGFFVAAFVRDESALQELSSRCSDADTSEQVEDTEEWQGFSEEETSEPTEEVVLEAKKSTHVSKK